MDPNEITETPNEAAEATEAAVVPQEPGADPVLTAMDKGVEEATPAPVEAAPEAAVAEPVAAQPDGGVKPESGEPEGGQPDKAVEDEITALGLKERSAARFRELTGEVKELAPLRDALKTAGVEDITELPRLVERAKAADDIVGMVMETGATSEQYGMTLDYLRLANQAARGDRKAAEQAFELMQGEMQVLARVLGREIPGIHDPLQGHADLQAAVEAGELTRERAAEVANARYQTQATQQAQQTQAEQQRAQFEQQQGVQQLVAFDTQMQADPAYVAKRPILNAMVANIRATLPPAQWLAATQQAYATIPDVPAPVAAPSQPAAPTPVRPSGPTGSLKPATFDSVEDALEFGLKQAAG